MQSASYMRHECFVIPRNEESLSLVAGKRCFVPQHDKCLNGASEYAENEGFMSKQE